MVSTGPSRTAGSPGPGERTIPSGLKAFTSDASDIAWKNLHLAVARHHAAENVPLDAEIDNGDAKRAIPVDVQP